MIYSAVVNGRLRGRVVRWGAAELGSFYIAEVVAIVREGSEGDNDDGSAKRGAIGKSVVQGTLS